MAQVRHPGGRTCADFTDTNPIWLQGTSPTGGQPPIPDRSHREPVQETNMRSDLNPDRPAVPPTSSPPPTPLPTRHRTGHDNGYQQKLDDDYLRAALVTLAGKQHWPGTPEWEAIGQQLIELAARDAQGWSTHAEEYQSSYIAAAIKLLRKRPDTVGAARSPWALLVVRGQTAGRTAVGAEASLGLTNRNNDTHQVRFTDVPQVITFGTPAELEDRLLPVRWTR